MNCSHKKIKNLFSNNSNRFLLMKLDFSVLLKSLPSKSTDLILTDPPYAISKKTGFQSIGKKSVKRFAVSMDFGEWDQTEINLNEFANLSYLALRDGGTIICFYDLWKITKLEEAFKKAGFKMLRLIIWEKTNPVPLNSKRSYLTNSREVAVMGVKGGKPTFNSEYDNGVYSMPIHREKRLHPTQKPLKLMEEIIKKHSQPNDLVVDPFLGSGTTGVASLKLKRRFIGGDKDNRYVIKARRRIEEEDKKRTLFRTSKARPDRTL